MDQIVNEILESSSLSSGGQLYQVLEAILDDRLKISITYLIIHFLCYRMT